MTETVFHEWREAGFEAFPAENYVDYMTNVMPVPEMHAFYLPSRGKAIICEIRGQGDRQVLEWSLRGYDRLPTAKSVVRVEKGLIEEMLSILDEHDEPILCEVCEKILGAHLRRVR